MEKKQNSSENVILVGSKPFMNYVTGVVIQFTTKKANKVTIKSRGKFISKAVDVSEVARRRFLEGQNITTEKVRVGSEEFENKEGKKVNVSTLEIDLIKN
jgi:archaea-specific DNA-binding protein